MNRDLGVKLEDFVSDLLVRNGALVEKPSYALVEALLPDELSSLLATDHLLLAFDYEVAAETPGSLFITHGSPLLDTMVGLAVKLGRYTTHYWPGNIDNWPRNLSSKIKEAIDYLHCRPPQVELHWTAENIYYGFWFRCIFRSYEKSEKVILIVINGTSGLPCPDFKSKWDHLVPFEASNSKLPPASLLPLTDIYRQACQSLKPLAQEEALALQHLSSKLRQREWEKVNSYYQKTIQELESKRDGSADPNKKARFEKQLTVTKEEWNRREKDIAGRYEVEVDVCLERLEAYYVPCEYMKLRIQHKKQILNHTLIYNPVLRKIDTPPCPLCGKATSFLMPDKTGNRLVCLEHGDQ